MTINNYNLDDILLQKPPMCLIDRVVDVNEQYVVCETHIKTDNIFFQPEINGIYHWIGVEMMAQTAAVYVYFKEKNARDDHQPKIAFLTSIRQFFSSVTHYPLNSLLTITATNIFLDKHVAAFDCEILLDNEKVAVGKLSAYQPSANDIKPILKG